MIYRRDHRRKAAQVDDTPRRRKGEEPGTSWRSDAESPRSRALQTSEDAPARLLRSEIGEESSPGAPEKSRRAHGDVACATLARVSCARTYTYPRRKGKRKTSPQVLITPTWPGTRAPAARAFRRGIFPIIRRLIKYHS